MVVEGQPTFPCIPGKIAWDSEECGSESNPTIASQQICGNQFKQLQIKGNMLNQLSHSPVQPDLVKDITCE